MLARCLSCLTVRLSGGVSSTTSHIRSISSCNRLSLSFFLRMPFVPSSSCVPWQQQRSISAD